MESCLTTEHLARAPELEPDPVGRPEGPTDLEDRTRNLESYQVDERTPGRKNRSGPGVLEDASRTWWIEALETPDTPKQRVIVDEGGNRKS